MMEEDYQQPAARPGPIKRAVAWVKYLIGSIIIAVLVVGIGWWLSQPAAKEGKSGKVEIGQVITAGANYSRGTVAMSDGLHTICFNFTSSHPAKVEFGVTTAKGESWKATGTQSPVCSPKINVTGGYVSIHADGLGGQITLQSITF